MDRSERETRDASDAAASDGVRESGGLPNGFQTPVEGEPSPRSPSGSANNEERSDSGLLESLRQAATEAQGLAEQLSQIARQAELAGEAISPERVRTLDDRLNRVREVAVGAGGIDELAELETLLHGWEQKPSDLLIMVKIAEEASLLARIVRAHAEVLRLLES